MYFSLKTITFLFPPYCLKRLYLQQHLNSQTQVCAQSGQVMLLKGQMGKLKLQSVGSSSYVTKACLELPLKYRIHLTFPILEYHINHPEPSLKSYRQVMD